MHHKAVLIGEFSNANYLSQGVYLAPAAVVSVFQTNKACRRIVMVRGSDGTFNLLGGDDASFPLDGSALYSRSCCCSA